MGTASDRRTMGFRAVMKRLHYAWIIVFITFLILLAVQGVRLSFGAFVEPWEREFSLDRGTISLISTLSFIVYGISQPVIGRLVDRWGARAVLLWSTLLTGISIFSTCFITSPWQLFLLYGLGCHSELAGVECSNKCAGGELVQQKARPCLWNHGSGLWSGTNAAGSRLAYADPLV